MKTQLAVQAFATRVIVTIHLDMPLASPPHEEEVGTIEVQSPTIQGPVEGPTQEQGSTPPPSPSIRTYIESLI